MDENVFWIRFWCIIATVLVAIALIIAVWYHYENERYAKMWTECVNVGGQPLSEPMLGRDSITFTCKRQ